MRSADHASGVTDQKKTECEDVRFSGCNGRTNGVRKGYRDAPTCKRTTAFLLNNVRQLASQVMHLSWVCVEVVQLYKLGAKLIIRPDNWI